MHEPRSQRGGHAVRDAPVAFAVAAGDQGGSFRQFVFADLAVQHQLVQRGLDHGNRRGKLFKIDEPPAGVVRWRQEGRRRPDDAGLARLDQQFERFRQLARAQGIVGGEGLGIGHV